MTTTSAASVVRSRAPDDHPGRSQPLRGTGRLLLLALRRDRILLPAWILGFTLMVTFSVTATKDLYPTDESLASAADLINATAALVALYGKVYVTTLGAVSLIKMTVFGAALVAILFVFLVVRHSRAEEESGRLELVAAGAVGRAAPLTAALLLGIGSSLALGVVTALGLSLVGLPVAGSVAFGLSWALSGIVFSAVAAVAAQVTTSARAAIGLGLMGVGIAYALRAVGDLAQGDPGWLSWLSPIGWSQQIRPFAGDRWWVTVLPVAATVVLVVVAYALRSRRDLGSGLLPDRLGPAVGRIDGVPALAWRLQRGMFFAWLIAATVMGFVLGSVANNVSGFFDSPEMQRYLVLLGGEQGLTEAFLAAEVGILGALIGAYGIAATLRLRTEETSGHAESVLAGGTTRIRWAASHFVIALLGGARHPDRLRGRDRAGLWTVDRRRRASDAGGHRRRRSPRPGRLGDRGHHPVGVRVVAAGRAGGLDALRRVHRPGRVRRPVAGAAMGAGPVALRPQPHPAGRCGGAGPVAVAGRGRRGDHRPRHGRVAASRSPTLIPAGNCHDPLPPSHAAAPGAAAAGALPLGCPQRAFGSV